MDGSANDTPDWANGNLSAATSHTGKSATAISKCSDHEQSPSCDTATGALESRHHGRASHQDHPHQRHNTWRAGCGESRTSGSEGGPQKPTSRNADRALRSDPYSRLPGPGKGVWFYRYAVWDLLSRKNVGWCVDIVETVEIPEWLMTVTIKREHVDRDQLIIHSDRGAQMTAGTITDLYDMLGIRPSLSRPRMSNDNPHAEARVQNVEVPAGLARPVRDPRHRDLALRNFLRLVQPRPPSHRDRPPDTSGPSRRQRTTNQHRPPDRARQRPPTPPRTIPERATPTTPPEYGSTPPNYTPDNPTTQTNQTANNY